MNIAEWKASLASAEPPSAMPPLVEALWWDARGGWQRAHTIAQDVEGRDGAWVHAYLHRKESDEANAGYWYSRAGKPHSRAPLDKEREEIVAALLSSGD